MPKAKHHPNDETRVPLKQLLVGILFVIFLLHLLFRIYGYRNEYTVRYNPKYWESRYLLSQWVVPNSTNLIGDDGLYAYAGWEYINGRDPSTLNAELPPLGKYFIGASILLFGNQNYFALFSGLTVLVLLYVLNRILFKDTLLAFIPVALFSFEPLFYTQLRAPFLDLLHLLFLLLMFIFLLKKKYFLSMVALGLMMGVKASSATFVLGAAVGLTYVLLSKQKNDILRFTFSVPVSLLTFTALYTRYFLAGHSIREFLGVQKWIITFYAVGAKGNPLTVWPMILSGTWNTWWGQTLHIDEWMLTWPILLGLYIIAIGIALMSRKVNGFWLLGLWCGAYLAFLLFVPVWPRYLLLLLPFLYNLAIWAISKSIPAKFLPRLSS